MERGAIRNESGSENGKEGNASNGYQRHTDAGGVCKEYAGVLGMALYYEAEAILQSETRAWEPVLYVVWTGVPGRCPAGGLAAGLP